MISYLRLHSYLEAHLKCMKHTKVTCIWSIPAHYDYTHMHFPTPLFIYTFRSIPEGAMNAKCMTQLNMSGYYSLNGNGCNLLMELVIYND
jgi:hypothetical protein